MRAACGCLVEDDIVMHGYDGPCFLAPAGTDNPTTEEYCAAGDHEYYGDDSGRGRCYCGLREYPPGGPT